MPTNKTSFYFTPTRLALATSVFLVLSGNWAFFNKLTEVYPWGIEYFQYLLSVGVVLGSVLILLMTLLGLFLPMRIVASLFVLLAAMIGFFSDRFGTIIDTEMIRNILETDVAEAGDLLTGGFLLHFVVLGVFPLLAIWITPYRSAALSRELRYKLQAIASIVVVVVLCLFTFSSTYTGFFRQHKSVRYYTNPAYALYSAGSYIAEVSAAAAPLELIRTVPQSNIEPSDESHELIILVVGETVRRDRLSLNGYQRQTNPLLAKESNLISYTHISACGTSTSVSVPCMFAFAGHDDFDHADAAQTENVLDVLSRAGVSVLWRDNNSGSKGVADRVAYEDFRAPEVNPLCDNECRDIGMLHGLQDYIDAQSGDTLIVLHQMGNHGPAYFKRYPDEFERFTPACKSEDLSSCTDAEIGNAYDNAILYTDYFLSEVIALLKNNTPEFETAMLYVSDHGESLGEKGLYLHGLPYLLAPAAQTEVPLVLWASDTSDIDLTIAVSRQDEMNSHDAVSHSLLSLFEIETPPHSETPLLFALKTEDDD